MRHFSEIPSTPTPMFRRPELSVGSTLVLPSTGRVTLRFVGPVKGKKGSFAGLELVDQPHLGKNSGDFQGTRYFTTSVPGSGLFMPFEKLLLALSDTPDKGKRLSMIGSPMPKTRTPLAEANLSRHTSTLRNTQAKGRSHNSTPPLNTRLASKPPSTARMSPVSHISPAGKSALESELQILLNTKIIIEAERNNLVMETAELRKKLQETQNTLDQNNELLSELQKTQSDARSRIQVAEERAEVSENKLVNQRRLYESQRKELLEVIDQVEAQVNDNEQLYIAEMKKLQEELSQKQEIIDGLQVKLSDLQTQFDKQKQSGHVIGDKAIDDLRTEVENLQLTNLTQVKAIKQLQTDAVGKEKKVKEMSKETLLLKESFLNEKDSIEIQMTEQIQMNDHLKKSLGMKEQELSSLRQQLESASKTITKQVSNTADIDTLQKSHELELLALNKQISNLEKQLRANTVNDKVQELEFKLENKECIISDLRTQLAENHISTGPDEARGEELIKLNEFLKSKDSQLLELSSKLDSLKINEENVKILEKKLAEKELIIKQMPQEDIELKSKLSELEKKLSELQRNLKEKESLIKEQKEKLSAVQDPEVMQKDLEENETNLIAAHSKIKSLTEDLEAKELENKRIVEFLDSHKSLESELSAKAAEISELTAKLKALEDNKEILKDSELEEKVLEIEILKEELTELKSTDNSQEAERLRKELEDLNEKAKSDSRKNQELLEKVESLKKDVASRPSELEFQELKSNLELLDQLRQVESTTKENEITALKEKLKSLTTTNTITNRNTVLHEITKESSSRNSTIRQSVSLLDKRPSVISQVIDGTLQVHVPEKKDPVNGRKQWCGLCERTGHDSIDCPYENDIF